MKDRKDLREEIVKALEGKKKVYNVWICVEEIGEEEDDAGVDIDTRKIAKFKEEEKAIDFASNVEKDEDTPRDKEGFTLE